MTLYLIRTPSSTFFKTSLYTQCFPYIYRLLIGYDSLEEINL